MFTPKELEPVTIYVHVIPSYEDNGRRINDPIRLNKRLMD